jgi:hypothetical protein
MPDYLLYALKLDMDEPAIDLGILATLKAQLTPIKPLFRLLYVFSEAKLCE